jgi:hypothetical protein
MTRKKLFDCDAGGASVGTDALIGVKADRSVFKWTLTQLGTFFTALATAAITKASLGLSNVDNTADAGKPISTLTQAALDLKATQAGLDATNATVAGKASQASVDLKASQADHDTEVAARIAADALLAPKNSPALTGAPTAPTPVAGTNSTVVATTAFVHDAVATVIGTAPAALDTLNELATAMGNDPSFAGTVTTNLAGKAAKSANLSDLADPAAARVNLSLGNVNNTSDANKPVSTAQQTALDLKLNASAAGTFGLTLLGSTNLAAAKASLAYGKADVGLGNVDNTSDANKPVSTAQQTALNLKVDTSSSGAFGLTLFGSANLTAAKASLAYVKGDVGLGNVDNTSDVNKPVSTAQQTALNLKLDASTAGAFGLTLLGSANLAAAKASLAYVKGDVGLGNVDNTSDANKPVSTAQQTALNLKADVANPVHSGQIYFQQVAPTTKGAAATLTIAEILVSIVQYTGAAANLTLPTGTLSDAGILGGALAVDRAFEWVLINTGSGIATLVAGTAHTIVGTATVAVGATARFWTRKTATNTFVTYRTG